jgi:hypothetical protein
LPMSHRLFELFAKMVTALPVRAISKALELQCKMLEDDIERYRINFPEDTRAILSFQQFVLRAKLGQATEGVKTFSADYLEFFKETIVRLVQEKELPSAAMDQFDHAFVAERF